MCDQLTNIKPFPFLLKLNFINMATDIRKLERARSVLHAEYEKEKQLRQASNIVVLDHAPAHPASAPPPRKKGKVIIVDVSLENDMSKTRKVFVPLTQPTYRERLIQRMQSLKKRSKKTAIGRM